MVQRDDLEAVEAGIYDLLLLGPDAANACEDVDNTRCGFVVAGGVDKVVVLSPGGRDHDVTGNGDIGTELVAHRSIVGYNFLSFDPDTVALLDNLHNASAVVGVRRAMSVPLPYKDALWFWGRL